MTYKTRMYSWKYLPFELAGVRQLTGETPRNPPLLRTCMLSPPRSTLFALEFKNSKFLLVLLYPFGKGFTTYPSPFRCWNLQLVIFFWWILYIESVDWMLSDGENLEVEQRPSVRLQNLGLKNSAPGSLQHVYSAESVLKNLPFGTAKSYDISSSAISSPCTRVSSEFIPVWELPMNL